MGIDATEEQTAELLAAQEHGLPEETTWPIVPQTGLRDRFTKPLTVILGGLLLLGSLAASRSTGSWSTPRPEEEGSWEALPEAALLISAAEALPEEHVLGYAAHPELLGAMRTQCVIDTVQATAYLGSAVVMMRNAVASSSGLACPDDTHAGCAVSASGFVLSVAWVASYLSLAASSCGATLNPAAQCAADWTAIVANMGELAMSGAGVSEDCDFRVERPHIKAFVDRIKERSSKDIANKIKDLELEKQSLEEKLEAEKLKARHPVVEKLTAGHAVVADMMKIRSEQLDRDWDQAMCSFDVTNAASYIVRVILQIRAAALDCEDKRSCAIDVLNIISSFAWIAQLVALAVSDCPEGSNQKAKCTADISDLVAGVTNFAAAAMSSIQDCAEKPDIPKLEVRGPIE